MNPFLHLSEHPFFNELQFSKCAGQGPSPFPPPPYLPLLIHLHLLKARPVPGCPHSVHRSSPRPILTPIPSPSAPPGPPLSDSSPSQPTRYQNSPTRGHRHTSVHPSPRATLTPIPSPPLLYPTPALSKLSSPSSSSSPTRYKIHPREVKTPHSHLGSGQGWKEPGGVSGVGSQCFAPWDIYTMESSVLGERDRAGGCGAGVEEGPLIRQRTVCFRCGRTRGRWRSRRPLGSWLAWASY